MQPLRAHLTCRAPNRFNPSIALWDHFVAHSPPNFHHPRFSSTATEAAQDGPSTNSPTAEEVAVKSEEANGNPQSNKANSAPKITKIKNVRSKPHPVPVPSEKTKRLLYATRQSSHTPAEKFLADARAAFEDSREYMGVIASPAIASQFTKESSLPWSLREKQKNMPGIDVLEKEIQEFYKYTKPQPSELRAREDLIKRTQGHVRKYLKKHDVEVFGSQRHGVALATSDIDFRLLWPGQPSDPETAKLPPPTGKERKKATNKLVTLFKRGFKADDGYLMACVRHARYPLISTQDRHTGLDVQIVLSNDTSHSTAIMKRYMEEIPYLEMLYYVVKVAFDVRGLSDVFRGGFGSYSLFMMVVASIKHAPHPRQDAAGGLINFLKFYSEFDTTKHGISIEPVELFDKKQHPCITDTVRAKIAEGKSKPLPEYMLSLRDPADETNDLCKKGIAIIHVQTTLAHLLKQLKSDIKINDRPSLLAPLVGASYMLDMPRRRRIQKHGQRLLEMDQKRLSVLAKEVREASKKGQLKQKDMVDAKAMDKGIEEKVEKAEKTEEQAEEQTVEKAEEQTVEKVEEAKEQAEEKMDDAKKQVEETQEQVEEKAGEVKEQAEEETEQVKEQVADKVQGEVEEVKEAITPAQKSIETI